MKGNSMSSFCLQKTTVAVCTTSAVRVRHCPGWWGVTDNIGNVPPCLLARRDLAVHCISLESTLEPIMNLSKSSRTYEDIVIIIHARC